MEANPFLPPKGARLNLALLPLWPGAHTVNSPRDPCSVRATPGPPLFRAPPNVFSRGKWAPAPGLVSRPDPGTLLLTPGPAKFPRNYPRRERGPSLNPGKCGAPLPPLGGTPKGGEGPEWALPLRPWCEMDPEPWGSNPPIGPPQFVGTNRPHQATGPIPWARTKPGGENRILGMAQPEPLPSWETHPIPCGKGGECAPHRRSP